MISLLMEKWTNGWTMWIDFSQVTLWELSICSESLQFFISLWNEVLSKKFLSYDEHSPYLSQPPQPTVVYFFKLVYFLVTRTSNFGLLLAHFDSFLHIITFLLAILSRIYTLFGVLCTGLNNVVYQNWQVWGMKAIK